MVHVADRGEQAAPRPGAAPVPQRDRAADVRRDVLRISDVEGEAGGGERAVEELGAEQGGDAGRAGLKSMASRAIRYRSAARSSGGSSAAATAGWTPSWPAPRPVPLSLALARSPARPPAPCCRRRPGPA